MSHNSRREIPWMLILVAMVFAFPVGMILLFIKLFSGSSSYSGHNTNRTYQSSGQSGRPNYGYRGTQQTGRSQTGGSRTAGQGRAYQPASQTEPGAYRAAPDPPGAAKTERPRDYVYDYRPANSRTLSPRLNRKLYRNGGKGLQITGMIILICAAVASVLTFAGTMSSYYGLFESGLYATIVAISVGLPGAVFAVIGNTLRGRSYRCQQYYTMIGGRRTVDIRELAAAIPVSYSKACKDLQWMITEGFFPGAYIDASRRCLTYSFAAAEPPRREEPKQSKTEEAPKQPEAKPAKPGVFEEVIRIRQLNDEIEDPFVTDRMYRLEELTQKILVYVQENPKREDRIHQFKDHYLPKTIKILESYSRFEKQGVNGANIRAAMKDVEEIMDTLVAGFEKQLDMLFDDEALDVTTDINVLESMMGLQGLRSDDPFRLELMGDES